MKSFVALAIFALLSLSAMPAYAQATRTWVSGVGDDANPCSRTAPCKTFAGAISKTAAGGEINAIDPGGFGAVTITKALSIIVTGVEGGVLVSGTNGITVNAGSTDFVNLEGLDIQGLNANGSQAGISFVAGHQLTIKNCRIQGFVNGISVTNGVLASRALVTDSLIVGNQTGLNLAPTGGVISKVFLKNDVFQANTTASATVNGSAAELTLFNSVFFANPTGPAVQSGGSGVVQSYGNNALLDATDTVPAQVPLH